jgi:regulatory protein
MTEESRVAIRSRAMDLLARREHSTAELRRKLKAREFERHAVEQALEALQDDGLLSDARFAEAFVYRRFNAGMGPLKIAHELRQKGVDATLADECLAVYADRWQESMLRERARRFGDVIPEDYGARMKQARFLQNRGFSPESVMRLFR